MMEATVRTRLDTGPVSNTRPGSGKHHGDTGSILPLAAGFGALILALIVTVTAATSLYIAHKRLLTLTDASALAAAEAFVLDDAVLTHQTVVPVFDSSLVSARVERFIRENSTLETRILAVTANSREVQVSLATLWTPPIAGSFFSGGFELTAASSASSRFTVQ